MTDTDENAGIFALDALYHSMPDTLPDEADDDAELIDKLLHMAGAAD